MTIRIRNINNMLTINIFNISIYINIRSSYYDYELLVLLSKSNRISSCRFMSCDIYVYVLIRGLTLTLRTGQFESGRESPSLRLDTLSKAGIWAVRYDSLDLT